MSQNGEEGKYQLVTENHEVKTTSRGFTGYGTATYQNQDIYEGDFIDGHREGRGIYRYFEKADKYEGQWSNNFRHGIGKMIYNNIGEYHGYWENGKRHGEGVFTYAKTGDVYSGWWRFGEKSGHGTYVFKETGMKLVGEWEGSQMKTGQWIYPNGLYWKGAFEANKPIGKGTWYFRNGNTLEGEFDQKEKVLADDEEPPAEEEEENAPKKKDLIWQSATNIAEAAHNVNSVEQ